MDQKEAEELFRRYQEGTATKEERALVESWYARETDKLPAEADEALGRFDAPMWAAIESRTKATRNLRIRQISPYIAAALLLIGLGYFVIVRNNGPYEGPIIPPGYNQATLTLADGTKVELDSAQSGIIVNDENIKYQSGESVSDRHPSLSRQVGRLDPGSLSAKTSPTSGEMLNQVQHDALLQLTTPRAGQYQIILSDGTKVWLNANSTLKYPSKFTGDRREVFLEGEGYFEVAKSGNQPKAEKSQENVYPFIVKSRNQEILVLGTSFNVTAFNDEKETKTTLIEGKVQVRSQNLQRKTYNVKLLAPQQQAVVKGDSLTVSKADLESIIAWRNGYFKFDGDIKSIMAQLARWYDVQVIYEGNFNNSQLELVGKVSRSKDLATVLKILGPTDKSITFSIDKERRVHVRR